MRWRGYVLSLSIALGGLLAGCAGTAPPVSMPPNIPAAPPMQAPATIDSYPVSFKEFRIPAGQTLTPWITIGADGAVWFITSAGVDSLNGTGTVHTYTLPVLTGYTYIASTLHQNVFFMGSCPLGRPDFGLFQGIYNVSVTGVISPDSAGCGAMEVSEENIAGIVHAPGDGIVVLRNLLGQFGIVQGGSFNGGLRYYAKLEDGLVNWGTAGRDNNFYAAGIATNGETFIAKVRPNTNAYPAVFRLPVSGQISDMAAGVDGNLWLVEPERNVIARISTSGTNYTEFAVPTPNAGLNAIVAAPDGALYFTESAAGRIGRITTAGTIMEFRTPSGEPGGITACPTLCEGAHVRLFVGEGANTILRFEY